MHLLLSNDDGIDALGLRKLEECVGGLGEVWVVAPDSERSAQSHALTMHKPLRVQQRDSHHWEVSGTPADCVYLALHHLLPEPPALVLAGINRGSNLGSDIFYSGTVAAAMEACLQGPNGIALSLHLEPGARRHHWETAGEVARRVVEAVLEHPLPPKVLLNVNVPNVPIEQLKGLAAAALGVRRYAPMVDFRTDPRGRSYYWLGGPHEAFESIDGTDGPTVEAGWASVTPMYPDLTLHDALPDVRRWTDK